MLARIGVITMNTYREAVRARILHGLFALALCTASYALIVGEMALRSRMRVIGDVGAASISLYGIAVAIVLGATSLYREIELKTIFPMLARPIRRGEYLVGKYLGAVMTMGVFVAANAGVLLLALAVIAGASLARVSLLGLGSLLVAGVVAWRRPAWRTFMPIPWALGVAIAGVWMSAEAPEDRQVIVAAATLTIFEIGIVTAIATVFSSFSSPFLTAVFTAGVFLVGRSADTLARLPERYFGSFIHQTGVWLSKLVPNLMLYVPERRLLLGQISSITIGRYLAQSAAHAVAWSVVLVVLASILFRRRDFS